MSFLDMIADGATTVEHALGGATNNLRPPPPHQARPRHRRLGPSATSASRSATWATPWRRRAWARCSIRRGPPTGSVRSVSTAGNFQVVPDDFVGPRLPNQVSQHEYENIAHEYSDIRLDRTDLHMDTSSLNAADAAQYRRDAMAQMGRMMETGSGRGLIDGLAHNAHNQSVTLSPFRDAAGAIDPTNAQSQPDSPTPAR